MGPVDEKPWVLFTFLPLICWVLLDSSVCFWVNVRVNVHSPAAKCFTNKQTEGYGTAKQLFSLSRDLAWAWCPGQTEAFPWGDSCGFLCGALPPPMPPPLAIQPNTATFLLLQEKPHCTLARAACWNVCPVAPAPQENLSYIQSNNWVQAAQAETQLTVGTAGRCQGEQPPREVRTAKLNNHRLVPHPPPAEQQPSHRCPWGWDQGTLLIRRGTPCTPSSASGFHSPQRGVMLHVL